jgi:hypothetical protein
MMMEATRFQRHHESSATIGMTTEALFKVLDNHARLSSHMRKPSWRMAWSTMTITMDERAGKAVGAPIMLRARVLGLRLSADEVVTQREPPRRKQWETVGSVRLLVIAGYRMGFEITPKGSQSELSVHIDYNLPSGVVGGFLGRLFAARCARWCTGQMVSDASKLGTPQ